MDHLNAIESEAIYIFREGGGYQFLAVTAEHAVAVANLPSIHRDPFDGVIITPALKL